MLREVASVSFDDEAGMPSLAATGVPITLETVGELSLGPTMQMLCRSRLMMPADVTIVNGRADAYREEHGTRRKGTHVSLMVQHDSEQEVCMWAARVGATQVMSCLVTLRAPVMGRAAEGRCATTG